MWGEMGGWFWGGLKGMVGVAGCVFAVGGCLSEALGGTFLD